MEDQLKDTDILYNILQGTFGEFMKASLLLSSPTDCLKEYSWDNC